MSAEHNPLHFKSLSGEIFIIDFSANVEEIQTEIAHRISTPSESYLARHIIIFASEQDQDLDLSRPPIILPDTLYSFIVQKDDYLTATIDFSTNAFDEEEDVNYFKYTIELWEIKMWEDGGENTLLQSFSIYWDCLLGFILHQDLFTVIKPSNPKKRFPMEKIKLNQVVDPYQKGENGQTTPIKIKDIVTKYLNIPWCQKERFAQQLENKFRQMENDDDQDQDQDQDNDEDY
jgi:hypothetical protein